MPRTFKKTYRRGQPGSPKLEALALGWLGEAPGGVRTPQVKSFSDSHLELEYLPTVPPADGAAEAFGRALARTHAAGAPHFGAAPPGWAGPGGIGLAPLSFTAKGGLTWGEFYASERVAPYARAAERLGALPPGGLAVFGQLGERLAGGVLDAPQPGLLEPAAAARVHGDLWTGNIIWTDPFSRAGGPWTGAAVVDPAAHGGHAETDLAMLALFGLAGLATVLDAYNEVSPLADGWRERVGLHQLFPLLVHATLFGGSYGPRAVDRAREYL
ncbi:MAG: fructosamine kinase family protein [Bifidobacteriaceae bacterium]|nr:fructosamine kinase family protein [Bifidobacteriaceae bacterium]